MCSVIFGSLIFLLDIFIVSVSLVGGSNTDKSNFTSVWSNVRFSSLVLGGTCSTV